MNQLHSKINIRSEDFKTNQTAMQSLVDELKQRWCFKKYADIK